MKKVAENRVVGDPFNESTTNGALISDAQFNRVLSYIEKGKKQGARVVTGGERLGNKGYFVKPTIFADVKDDMIIAKDEVLLVVFLKLFKYYLKNLKNRYLDLLFAFLNFQK